MGAFMIKKITFKKISLTVLLLLLFFLLRNYPEEINDVMKEKEQRCITIYLIDENDFVAMSTINESSNETLERVRSIIEALTINSGKELKEGFKAIIPEGTKLYSVSLNDGMLKVDFSKEILKVSKNDEEKMIESIIYSLTEIREIDKVMIFVEGERLMKLPNSGKRLELYLDRSYGINKVIDIEGIKNTQMTTVYYLAKNEEYYYVPVSFISNDDDNIVNIIIKKLKTNTLNNSNLLSHLNYQVELMNYEIKDEGIDLNFNNVILDIEDGGKLKEEVKYAIYYSIRDSLKIDNVVFMVDSMKIDEVIGSKNG